MSNKFKTVGSTKKVNSQEGMMNSPCTIAETVQIARGVVEDALTDYHRNQGNVQLSMSIQIEILKELVFSSGMITEEEFRQQYMAKAKELQEIQRKRMNVDPEVTADMSGEVGEVEINVEE